MLTDETMINIDGSHGEGGGQIIRTALALSTLTGKPFRVEKIRHSRPKPGLKMQHLTCISALKELCFAEVEGDFPGSVSFTYIPRKVVPRTIPVDIGTAGSITLLLQSLLLPCMFAEDKVRLKIKGGTDVKWSMPIDYLLNIIIPNLSRYADFKVNGLRRGFYPKGAGFLDLTIKPKYHISDFAGVEDFMGFMRQQDKGYDLVKRQPFYKIKGISAASKELRQAEVSERQAKGVKRKLADTGCAVKIFGEYADTESVGTVVTLWPDLPEPAIGSDILGERKKRAESVGAEAAYKLLLYLNADCGADNHLADNLIPFLALCQGKIRPDKITGHIMSNIYVCENFLDVEFKISEDEIISV